MTIHEPVFIVGCGRSGTSLLFNLLSQHPDLSRTKGYPDGEDHAGWIAHGQCAMAGIGNVASDRYGSGINGSPYCLHLTEADATPEVVESMRRYYWTDVLGKDPARRVINKNPHLSNKLRYVLRIFPDARIIHVVRDCEPVVASWMAVMDQHPSLTAYLPDDAMPCLWLFPKPAGGPAQSALNRHDCFFPGGGAAMWIDFWRLVNMNIAPQMQDRPSQLCVVRYEDLVARPTPLLEALAHFCHLRPHRFEVSAIEGNTAARHVRLITPSLRQDIERRAAAARRHFGYGADDRAPRVLDAVPVPA